MIIIGDFASYRIISKDKASHIEDEYIQWTGTNLLEVLQFSLDSFIDTDEVLKIADVSGFLYPISIGDYIDRRKYKWDKD